MIKINPGPGRTAGGEGDGFVIVARANMAIG